MKMKEEEFTKELSIGLTTELTNIIQKNPNDDVYDCLINCRENSKEALQISNQILYKSIEREKLMEQLKQIIEPKEKIIDIGESSN